LGLQKSQEVKRGGHKKGPNPLPEEDAGQRYALYVTCCFQRKQGVGVEQKKEKKTKRRGGIAAVPAAKKQKSDRDMVGKVRDG